MRKILYAFLFLILGFAEPRGWLAMFVTAILLVEVGVTLADFVEEDLSRHLPASERINHTLLALNYGGILVLLLSVLWQWSGEPTGLTLVFHGPWSLLALGAACGVALFGMRDWFAAGQSDRLIPSPAAGLGEKIGDGRQWMSWIARDDLVRLILLAIATPTLSGPLNATAPTPVSNSAFAAALGYALRGPAILTVPSRLLHQFGGDFANELLLGGQKVVPGRATMSGFDFRFLLLETALEAMLRGHPTEPEDQPARRVPGLSAPQIFSKL